MRLERLTNVLASLAIGCASLLAQPVLAQTSASDVQVTGKFSSVDSLGARTRISFTCTGTPTCTGIANISVQEPYCSNGFSFSEALVFTGLDLSAPGTFQIGVHPTADWADTRNADGVTCTYFTVPLSTDPGLFWAGSWDGKNGTIADNPPNTGAGTFTATGLASAPPPVFPMTVTSNITTSTATASATIQPRPQDVGTTQSVFVFAQIPASRVSGSKRASSGPALPAVRFDGDVCVLAQLNQAGQFTAVSASSMQPYLTGVINAQGQAITILNNVATANVAGATFFVGYGQNAGAMLSNGVYQAAVVVPGSEQCQTSLSSAPAPNSPGGLSGLWWNPNESGWGIHFTQRRNILFAAWYTYDDSGNPKWYVAPSCTMPAQSAGVSGTCTGNLYEVSGPAFFGVPFDASRVAANAVGSLQIGFTDQDRASMTYTLKGQSRTLPIVRQVFQTGPTPPAVDYTDLWWNPAESGWGIAVSQQYGVMFLAWFVYDDSGKPVWYVVPDCVVTASSCSGALYRTTGPVFGATFDPSKVQAFQAGTVKVTFGDANNGSLNYTINGVTSSKKIQRQVF